MLRKLLASLFVLAVCGSAEAASVTPPNLTAQTSVANSDLMLVWPAASVGPLQAITWANVKAQIVTDLGGSSWLKPSNNLSDVSNATTARTNLGLGSIATVNAGTSGNTVCILNNACTWAASQAFGGGLTGPGAVSLNATQGAWTPVLAFTTPGTSSWAYGTQVGEYACASGMVTVSFSLTATPTLGTASGAVLISGMPYTLASNWVPGGAFSGIGGGLQSWTGFPMLGFSDSTHLRPIWTSAPASGGSNVFAPAQFTGAAVSLSGSITYQTSTGAC